MRVRLEEFGSSSGIVDVNGGPFAGRHNWTARR
jgi:hypothetical protein